MKTTKDLYMSGLDYWGDMCDSPLYCEEGSVIQQIIGDNRSFRLIEAGTGSGRIFFRIREKYPDSSVHIDAFDFMPEFVETVRRYNNKYAHGINFFVADISDLSLLGDNTYDIVLCLQQIISFIPSSLMIAALSECYRICKPNGTVAFSFLDYDSRWFNKFLSGIFYCLRLLRKSGLSKFDLPYLHLNHKINLSMFAKDQATCHWFKRKNLEIKLVDAGFRNVEFVGQKHVICQK